VLRLAHQISTLTLITDNALFVILTVLNALMMLNSNALIVAMLPCAIQIPTLKNHSVSVVAQVVNSKDSDGAMSALPTVKTVTMLILAMTVKTTSD
jgi:hypothetical protein